MEFIAFEFWFPNQNNTCMIKIKILIGKSHFKRNISIEMMLEKFPNHAVI